MPLHPAPVDPAGVPVVLDTDIGTDVDDLLALILLAGDPSVDLRAVTTVYGDVRLRAQLASRVLRLLGRDQVPVFAGEVEPQSGREVWWAGHEGDTLEGLDEETVRTRGGVDALLEAAERHAGELVVVAIGPLTNVATALDRDPSFATAVRRLVVMGGEFTEGRPEHNLRCDVMAAQKVLGSGMPTVVVGLDVTTTVWFGEQELATSVASRTELAGLVEGQVRRWWRFVGESRNHPHDPLAVLALTEPDRFSFERGGWRVIDDHDRAGAVVHDDDAPHLQRAVRVDGDGARASIVRRLATTIARASDTSR